MIGIRLIAISLLLLPLIATSQFRPQIPKTWDEEALNEFELPLAGLGHSPAHVSSDYYYRIPVTAIPRTYPVYSPDREPPGYLAWLKQQEPQSAVEFENLRTKDDWIRAGELVFNAPFRVAEGVSAEAMRHFSGGALYPRAARDGTYPYVRYWVAKKGDVRAFFTVCGSCHTRVLNDGTVVPGAQGNMNERVFHAEDLATGRADLEKWLSRMKQNSIVPWLQPPPANVDEALSRERAIAVEESIVPGTFIRTGTNPLFPPKMPDLIGVENRRYLDATGLVQHRSIGDLMRYAALVDGMELFSSYDSFRPFGNLPDPKTIVRHSDEALYALALYIYSLKPPKNPNRFDDQAQRGQKVFQREGCPICHTPPLYTNNKLIPVDGFAVRDQHKLKYAVFQASIGVDPRLALQSRKGTGYYRVPSLKGVWYQGPFQHNGSMATLEDWFNPDRLRSDYVPTGFVGYGVKARAVKGHEFGLELNQTDKSALIAFLNTL